MPIGKPIANTSVYILDKFLQPVPVGVAGELYIGGDGLARGYLNSSELTAERFIPSPFSSRSGAVLYRTGDLARYLADGNIEFFGRIDQQLKIRGFRIELGEIESVLLEHPAIREVVVVALEEHSSVKQLVAYIVVNREGGVSEVELQSDLRRKLPNYMIPSVFIFLPSLPVTPNGKVDRRSLPTPEIASEQVEKKYAPPRNHIEIQLVKIWEDVLDVRSVSIKDNFFHLGGHSLLAMEILDRIEKVFKKTLPVALLFQCSTIELLGEFLHADGCTVPWTLIIPIQPNGSKPPYFVIHGNMVALASHIEIEQPIFSVMPHGMTGKRAPTDIKSMTLEYAKQIRAIQPKGPYYLGGYSIGGILALELARFFRSKGQQVASLILIEPTKPTKGKKNYIDEKTENPDIMKQRNGSLITYANRAFNNFFSKQGVKEKIKYLFKGMIYNIDRRFKITQKTKRIICELYIRSGHRIPMKLRRFYHSQASHKALKTYVPKVYPGNVSIIHCKVRDADFQLIWKKIIEGEVEFHELPGEHFDILNEPHVQVLAQKLSNCIQKHTSNVSNIS